MRYLSLFVAFPLLCAPVPVPGTAVSLEQPPGMEAAARFAGFESKTEAASLMVVELAAPVSGIISGFSDAKRLAAQRMTLDGTEKVKLAGGEASLFAFTQQQSGTEYKKLILAFGDEKKTVLVTGSYELKLAANWDKPIRASLLSVTLGAPQPSAAGFRVTPQGTYKLARAMSGSLALTPNGEFPLRDRRGPVYLGSRSLTPVPVEEPLAAFLETRAKALPGVKEFRVVESKPVMIDGLPGHELTGVANESAPETAQFVYEAVLREADGGYYLLVGLAPNDAGAENLPLFRAMSATFNRK